MTNKDNRKVLASNRKAFHNYQILEKIEAGISLNGYEVKSARNSNVSLTDSFVRFDSGEAFAENIFIAPYEYISNHVQDYDVKRKRKLLLHKSEINKISSKVKEKGLAVVPLEVYISTKGRLKILLGIGKGKHSYDKKEVLKKRDVNREMQREKNVRKFKI
ncbi:MAG: SsrA-binding protein SmpB [Elusimicrobiota bacterium]|jgi:SsrA-binding protein|nr:SsrA-binding protein SmpB [Elusimicrobiota bacterium]